MGLAPQLSGRPGHSPAMVAVGGGHKGHLPHLLLDLRPLQLLQGNFLG